MTTLEIVFWSILAMLSVLPAIIVALVERKANRTWREQARQRAAVEREIRWIAPRIPDLAEAHRREYETAFTEWRRERESRMAMWPRIWRTPDAEAWGPWDGTPDFSDAHMHRLFLARGRTLRGPVASIVAPTVAMRHWGEEMPRADSRRVEPFKNNVRDVMHDTVRRRAVRRINV